jgi:hypothetical protein
LDFGLRSFDIHWHGNFGLKKFDIHGNVTTRKAPKRGGALKTRTRAAGGGGYQICALKGSETSKIGEVVFITALPMTKLFAWGEGDSGGHVLRETTS